MLFRLVVPVTIFMLTSCATQTEQVVKFCSDDGLLVDANFEGGNFASCTITADGSVRILIQPEDAPIIMSPWYSFRVSASDPRVIDISIDFEDGYARYWPKLSTDRQSWTLAPEDRVQRSESGTSLSMTLEHEGGVVYVSGQELLTLPFYEDWWRELTDIDGVSTTLIGHSVQGRPIFAAATEIRAETIVLIGRQHPPELTGAWAMRPFAEAVLGDSDLAKEFRQRFTVIVVPLVNPDGVALGHWRHNVNGVDLNRDWGPFTQPETSSVMQHLQTFLDAGSQFRLMLDFHSTKINTFYTQLPEESKYAFDFATVWLDRSRERLPGFEFIHDARAHSGQSNTKNFFYDRYGIPAITYELGDETNRADIAASSPVFAEEMMRTLLEVDPNVVLSGRD